MTLYGIDLGTTYCAVSFYDPSRSPEPQPVLFDGRDAAYPSMVCVEPASDGRIRATVGARARDRFHALVGARSDAPEGVALIRGAKNFMAVRERTERGSPWTVGDTELYATEVSALLLRALKRKVEKAGYPPMERVVVTHPQRFKNRERLATQQAAELARLNLVGMLTEPDAAAWAYEMHEDTGRAERVVIFDFGGGTLDVVVMERPRGASGRREPRVLGSYGADCGGLRIDRLVREELLSKYLTAVGAADEITGDDDLNAWTREELLFRAEEIKRLLNNDTAWSDPEWETYRRRVRVEAARSPFQRFQGIDLLVTLGEYSRWVEPVVSQALSTVDEALKRAGLASSQVDEVWMTGQSSQLVPMRKALEARFQGRPVRLEARLESYLHPATIVASGAAVFGHHVNAGGAASRFEVKGAIPERFAIMSYDDASGPSGEAYEIIRAGSATGREYPMPFELERPLPGDGRSLPIDVVEGETNARVGRFTLEFPEPLRVGSRVDVSLKVSTNGRFTMGVTAQGHYREARLTEAEGIYGLDEMAQRLALLDAIELADI